MKTFNDNAGRTWTVAINVECIKRVKTLLSVNLLDAIEGKLIEQLVSDPILLCDVIFAICKPEADTKEISDEEFGRAMAGDAIDNATTALLEELVDFFPSGKRQVLAKALAKLKTFQSKAVETASKRLDDPRLDQQLEALLSEGELPETSPGS
ncbi:hypothetical protein Pan97_39400 [Bremerella volcania]|jgi:hypothetical protein|uniref:Uncharacterized protein n=1 Tax=Bremerella volcania TaxID=2527984 RepID=A0A518CCD0_9BACT|nr:hypothetical protein [Bremerella volcania]QDU76883.1 hypothetical protein Pan97_39400 [Bremerella volcania]